MTFSTVGSGWEAQTKETPMMGEIYVRCETCDQLSYDPRTGLCDERHVDESWEYVLPAEFQDLREAA